MNLKFSLNRRREAEFFMFFSENRANNRTGLDIFRYLIRGRLELNGVGKKPIKERKEYIFKYIERDHKKNKKRYQNRISRIKKRFRKISSQFERDTIDLFDGVEWPNGKYNAIFTIFRIYPRYLEEKIVFLPLYKSEEYAISTLIHELLHIYFFNYIDIKFKSKLPKELEWDFSEIINVILMNKKPFNKYYGNVSYPYPDHKLRYEYLNELYKKSPSMELFFIEAIKYLNQNSPKGIENPWER